MIHCRHCHAKLKRKPGSGRPPKVCDSCRKLGGYPTNETKPRRPAVTDGWPVEWGIEKLNTEPSTRNYHEETSG